MSGGTGPATSRGSTGPDDGVNDEGRRYWKAAIAHLAPEKREAAWEFYLDRLESSAAADTLGGVMLLLEAHLAFFDDLPTRLGQAARQIEAAFQAPKGPVDGRTSSIAIAAPALVSAPRRRWLRTGLVPALCATIGGSAVYATLTFPRHPGALAPASASARMDHLPYSYAGSMHVEPWYDPAARHPRGAIVSFNGVAWTERTHEGGAKVYVSSPVEEVRRDLEALRAAPR